MPNMLETGAAWLNRQAGAAAGRTVRYERQGAAKVASIVGRLTEQEYQIADADGFVTSFLASDWTFDAGDLASGGKTFEPQKGDRIVEQVGRVKRRYEVMPLGSKPPFETRDGAGLIVVVHTKRLKDY